MPGCLLRESLDLGMFSWTYYDGEQIACSSELWRPTCSEIMLDTFLFGVRNDWNLFSQSPWVRTTMKDRRFFTVIPTCKNLNLETWLIRETQRCIVRMLNISSWGKHLTERTFISIRISFPCSHHRCWDFRANAKTQFGISTPQAATKLCWNPTSPQNGKATCGTLWRLWGWKRTQFAPTILMEPDAMFYGIIWLETAEYWISYMFQRNISMHLPVLKISCAKLHATAKTNHEELKCW